MPTSLLYVFGDVFSYNEKDYIFLAIADDILYAALILTKTETDRVTRLYDKKLAANKVKSHPVFCFVMLETQEFKDRCASLGKPEMDIIIALTKQNVLIDSKDLKQIKEEIMRGNVPLKLKELVKDIEL